MSESRLGGEQEATSGRTLERFDPDLHDAEYDEGDKKSDHGGCPDWDL